MRQCLSSLSIWIIQILWINSIVTKWSKKMMFHLWYLQLTWLLDSILVRDGPQYWPLIGQYTRILASDWPMLVTREQEILALGQQNLSNSHPPSLTKTQAECIKYVKVYIRYLYDTNRLKYIWYLSSVWKYGYYNIKLWKNLILI